MRFRRAERDTLSTVKLKRVEAATPVRGATVKGGPYAQDWRAKSLKKGRRD